jgi:hypothetical protein
VRINPPRHRVSPLHLRAGIEEGANSTFGVGIKHVQSVLRDIERKVADYQRQQRARDTAAEVSHLRRRPVDIQIGSAVYEDMPQEIRARLYHVLAHRPDLAAALEVRGGSVMVVWSYRQACKPARWFTDHHRF